MPSGVRAILADRRLRPRAIADRRGDGAHRGLGASCDGTTRKGRPGFFLTDAVRGPASRAWLRRLVRRRPGAHQQSWLSRSPRLPARETAQAPLRILVLGDSVTFGHGTLDETTYPYLARAAAAQLAAGRQLGSLESRRARLQHAAGARLSRGNWRRVADPDLVVVGFFANDFTATMRLTPPSRGGAPPRRSCDSLSDISIHSSSTSGCS